MRRLYRLFVLTDARSRQLRELNENRKCGPENIYILLCTLYHTTLDLTVVYLHISG